MNEGNLIRLPEAAKMLGIHRATLWKRIKRKPSAYPRFFLRGGRLVSVRSEWDRFIKKGFVEQSAVNL